MCGTVTSPLYSREIPSSIGVTLRKSRSLQDFKADLILLEIPRIAPSRRRVSSVVDLVGLEARLEGNTPEMARETQGAANGSTSAQHPLQAQPDAPPLDPVPSQLQRAHPSASQPTHITPLDQAKVEISPSPPPALPTSTTTSKTTRGAATAAAGVEPTKSTEKSSFFESPFFTAGDRPREEPSSIIGDGGGGGPIKPSSLFTDTSVLPIPAAFRPSGGIISPPHSGATTPIKTSMDLGSLSLEDRRNSFYLGHVVPTSGHLGQGSAAVELFYRLNHARQTVDYVRRQAAQYAPLTRATMDVWEALDLLNSLREYESALVGGETCDADMPLLDHALQTAEACRLEFPEHEWMAVVGLVHGLGKILAHANFGAEPQWAVCGESFPVGCRFHPAVVHSQYFQANPDRRKRAYASSTGVYQAGCGLSQVCMSWSGAEYLYMVLARNRAVLPPEALFLVRYQKFAAVLRSGQPYGELLSSFDRNMLPMLTRFREIAEYRRVELPGRLEGEALRQHYDVLLEKYIPQRKMRW